MKASRPEPPRTAFSILRFLVRGAADLLYPPHCLCCGADTAGTGDPRLCPACLLAVTPVADGCPACGTPRGPFPPDDGRCDSCRDRALHFDGAAGAFLYGGPVKRLLHRLKFERFAAAAEPLAVLAARSFRDATLDFAPQALVPVPIHRARRLRRGFNQAELLARGMGRVLGLPVLDVLAKTRATEPQVDLPRTRRLVNPSGAFSVRRPAAVRGKDLLLVDDVITTAATVSEGARALKEAGAARVLAFAPARQRTL